MLVILTNGGEYQQPWDFESKEMTTERTPNWMWV
jgi:hypothetical protein